METAIESLDDFLRKWLVSIPEMKAASIISTEGLLVASTLPQDSDKVKISAMTAALLSLAKRSVKEMEKLKFDYIYVWGTQGCVLIIKADSNLILTVSTTKNVKLGLLILDCRRVCEEIKRLFKFNEEEKVKISKNSIRCPSCFYNMVRPFRDLCPNCRIDLKEIIKIIEQEEKKIEEKLEKIKRKHQKQREIEEDEHFMVFEDENYYGFESPIPSIPSRSIKKFLASIPGGNGVLISSLDGLPLASALPRGVNEWIIAPITTVLFTLAERIIIEMKKGEFKYLFIKDSNGYLLIQKVDNIALLMISLIEDARSRFLLLFNLIKLSDKKDFLKRLREYDEDGDVPFPYIFKPPTPPGDLGLAGEPQAKLPITEKIQWYEPNCKHCGAELPKGQTICHVCGKKVG
ncbi:MAG: roadblock/LC7 domain-containing protein [Promethearchaeota archaeon]